MGIFRKLGSTSKFLLLAPALMAAAIAGAQDIHRPVTILVPFVAGTNADLIARAVGEEMSKTLKQPVIVDNRPGAGEGVAATMLYRAPADGHTLMVTLMPNILAPAVQQTLPYKSISDFTAIGGLVKLSAVMAAGPQVPANNVKELLALLRAKPNNLTYGSSGVGSGMHLYAELFNKQSNTRSVHVPYKAVQNVMTDIASERLDYGFLGVNAAAQFAREGKLKLLGVSGLERSSELPDVPTIAEQGVSGFEGVFTYSLITTKGTPPAVVDILSKSLIAATRSEGYAARMKAIGGAQIGPILPPSQAAARLLAEETRWRQLVKDLNIVFE